MDDPMRLNSEVLLTPGYELVEILIMWSHSDDFLLLNNNNDVKHCLTLYSLRALEYDGATFDHEGPLIINKAQISLEQVARRVKIYFYFLIL